MLNNTTYTPIPSPIDCDYYLLIGCENGSAMYRSSDGTDENSYIMPSGMQYSMLAPSRYMQRLWKPRFCKGDIICHLKLVSVASDVVNVEFSV